MGGRRKLEANQKYLVVVVGLNWSVENKVDLPRKGPTGYLWLCQLVLEDLGVSKMKTKIKTKKILIRR